MNKSSASLRNAKGSVLVITALILTVLMGMAGLAIDMSHSYKAKTQLQNLADALALSAAASMSEKETGGSITDPEAFAENYAKTQTYPRFASASGNSEVNSGITCTAGSCTGITFTFAQTLSSTVGDWYAAASIADAKFVRVVISPINVTTWFANLIGFNNVAVDSTAVAGTAPTIPCDVAPILMCTEILPDGTVDTDCSDGACYGYKTNSLYCLRSGAQGSTDPADCPPLPAGYSDQGPGNFSLLDVGAGGADIKECLAGVSDCAIKVCENFAAGNAVVDTEPGVVAAGAKGFNTRFDIFQGEFAYDGTFKPDKIVGHSSYNDLSGDAHDSTRSDGLTANVLGSETVTDLYKTYTSIYDVTDTDATHPFEPKRRISALPFVKCTDEGGKHDVEVKGFGCFFFTKPMEQQGNKAFIYGEFTDDHESCNATGILTPVHDFGFDKVLLYKDPLPNGGLGGMS